MRHYGDIRNLSGHDLPIVDVITGGSPCQNLSVAGNRTGLQGEESGLFFEQIRIVKEMREHDRSTGRSDELIRPRYMVWENVPGAYSSNKGRDFQTVLTEIARIVSTNCPSVPVPKQGGGQNQGASWVTETTDRLFPSPGDYTMPSFGESPREENASHLSQILADSAPAKYSLSARACVGILRRAERRGKALPPELKTALEQQCTTEKI